MWTKMPYGPVMESFMVQEKDNKQSNRVLEGASRNYLQRCKQGNGKLQGPVWYLGPPCNQGEQLLAISPALQNSELQRGSGAGSTVSRGSSQASISQAKAASYWLSRAGLSQWEGGGVCNMQISEKWSSGWALALHSAYTGSIPDTPGTSHQG